MSSVVRSVAFFLTIVLPASAMAWEYEIELRPGEPPTPVVVPVGAHVDDVRVTLESFDISSADPTPQPAVRTLYVGGMPVSIHSAQVSSDPLRIEAVRVGGRDMILLSAQPYTTSGRVARVRALVTIAVGGLAGIPAPIPAGWRPSVPEPDPILAIVTTDRILNRSTMLSTYVRWREAGGYRVIVGTEQDWDFPVAEGRDHRAERIRAWLRQVRDTEGLGYVLLIGSPHPRSGSVPMVNTHPLGMLMPYMPSELAESLDPVPTDHFFSDLEGDWDLNDNGRYGEYPYDDGPRGVRWDADAMVGRIPVYGDDAETLDMILSSIIDYETDPNPGYRHRALIPAAFIGFEGSPAPGGGVYEETGDAAVAAMAAYGAIAELDADAEIIRFFEETGIIPSEVDHERPLTAMDVLDEWSHGAGLVVVYAHGSTQGDYRTAWTADINEDGIPNYEELLQDPFLHSWDTPSLEGVGRAFTFHASCENGWPEDSNNLGYALLKRGAIATVSASRSAIGGENDFEPAPELGEADTMAYTFSHLLLEGLRIGEVVAYLRYGLPADGWGEEQGLDLNGYGWLGKFEFNLYGDPTVGLGRCATDVDCNDGTLCNGEGQCIDGYCAQGELVDCTDLDEVCTVGRCDPDTGTCSARPRDDGEPCDDELFCTEDDACTAGVCGGGDRSCGDAPEGFVSICVEEERRCVIEPETVAPTDGGPGEDAGPSTDAAPESDAGPEDDAAPTPQFNTRGGGCSVTPAPTTGFLSVLTALF